MENHIKDEQIKRQSETIKSLERKVESLETELRKCLDPDSGEIRTAIHHKSGGYEPVSSNVGTQSRFEFIVGQMVNTLQGAWNIPDAPDAGPWRTFRHEITGNPRLKPYLQDDDFLFGFSIMNKVIDRIDPMWDDADARDRDFGAAGENPNGTEWYLRYWQSIPRILLGAQRASDQDGSKEWLFEAVHRGFQALNKAFGDLSIGDFESPEDYEEVKVRLECTLWCQKFILAFIAEAN